MNEIQRLIIRHIPEYFHKPTMLKEICEDYKKYFGSDLKEDYNKYIDSKSKLSWTTLVERNKHKKD